VPVNSVKISSLDSTCHLVRSDFPVPPPVMVEAYSRD